MSLIEENSRFAFEFGARTTGWLQQFAAVEAFTQATGKIPRHRRQGAQRASEGELADWLRYQRRRRVRGNATATAVALLECLPGFPGNPKTAPWEATLQRVEDFLGRSGGRPPRVRCSDPAERRFASWVDDQRRRLREQRLSADQRDALWRTFGPL